jgi:hypothetical protein
MLVTLLQQNPGINLGFHFKEGDTSCESQCLQYNKTKEGQAYEV